jgi:hypothetical protein
MNDGKMKVKIYFVIKRVAFELGLEQTNSPPGKPIPGNVVSPQASKDFIGVVHPGKSHYENEQNHPVSILENGHKRHISTNALMNDNELLTTSSPAAGAGPYYYN